MSSVARTSRLRALLPRIRSHSGVSVALVVVELVIVFMLGNLPTPLYGKYQDAITFSELTLTLIFAVYVVGALATMFFLGRLSDQIGRKPVALASIGLAALACVLFLAMSVVTSVPLLTAARIASGFAVALASGASTAWLVELTDEPAVGTKVAIVANLLGLGLGPVVAGLIHALYAPYVVLLALLGVAALAVPAANETIDEKKPVSLKPRVGVPKEMRAQFASAAIGGFATFAVLGFYSALAPSMLKDAIGVRSTAAGGAIVGLLFASAAVTVALVKKRADVTKGMLAGLALMVPGVALLAFAELRQSFSVLVVATVVTGVACGLGYLCELRSVNEAAPPDRRSEVVSTFLIVCYAAISLPVIGVAIVGGLVGRSQGDYAFAAVVAVLTCVAIALEAWRKRRSSERPRASA